MQQKNDIERQKSNNKKDGLIMERTTRIEDKGKSAIEIIQKKKLDIMDEYKEKRMIRKGIVKEMLEKIERQNANTLKLVNIETLRKKLHIDKEWSGRAFCLAWHVCLFVSLYPRSYHNLANQSYLHTAHAHEVLHNYHIERSMK